MSAAPPACSPGAACTASGTPYTLTRQRMRRPSAPIWSRAARTGRRISFSYSARLQRSARVVRTRTSWSAGMSRLRMYRRARASPSGLCSLAMTTTSAGSRAAAGGASTSAPSTQAQTMSF